MRAIEDRPVYSQINPQEQPTAKCPYVFFSPQADLMGLRIACADVVNGDGFIKVLDANGIVIAKVSSLIPWQLVRRDVMAEEPYGEFIARLYAEEKQKQVIDSAAELSVYGQKEYDKRHAPKMVLMGSDGSMMPMSMPTQEEEPEKKGVPEHAYL